jgi:hypothetical protein
LSDSLIPGHLFAPFALPCIAFALPCLAFASNGLVAFSPNTSPYYFHPLLLLSFGLLPGHSLQSFSFPEVTLPPVNLYIGTHEFPKKCGFLKPSRGSADKVIVCLAYPSFLLAFLTNSFSHSGKTPVVRGARACTVCRAAKVRVPIILYVFFMNHLLDEMCWRRGRFSALSTV